jgi:hypothetical protein
MTQARKQETKVAQKLSRMRPENPNVLVGGPKCPNVIGDGKLRIGNKKAHPWRIQRVLLT